MIRAAQYSPVELGMLVVYAGGYFFYGGLHSLILWVGFAMCVLWVIMTATHDAEYHAKEMVKSHMIEPMDTGLAVVLLCTLAFLVRHEDWRFPVLFVVAALQNLRYTYLIARFKNEYTNPRM